MQPSTLISVEEYLASHYDPDRDYVDGVIEERNVGELDHSRMQGLVYGYLLQRERSLGILAFPELRVQVRPNRYRIPDICVVAGAKPREQVLRTPPFLCIEILAPSDSLDSMQERIDDYLTFGVPYVWVISPKLRRGWIHTPDSIREAKDGILRTANPAVEVPIAELFDND